MTPEPLRLVTLVHEGKDEEVQRWARPRADQGDPDAQFLLGYLAFGPADFDFREACAWLHRAARQGDAEALYHLAGVDESSDVLRTGAPGSEDQRSMLRRAAELGSIGAQRDLGCYLAIGEAGFPKNETEGRMWYGCAAQSGHVDAQYNFGLMCLHGEGGARDLGDGIAWLEKAAAADPAERWCPTPSRFFSGSTNAGCPACRRTNRERARCARGSKQFAVCRRRQPLM